MKTLDAGCQLIVFACLYMCMLVPFDSTLHGQSIDMYESILTPGQNSAKFSKALSTAGDTDHDGYEDILTGAYNFDNGQSNEGKLFLFKGAAEGVDNIPDWTFESDQVSAQLGYDVIGGRDINNDGYTDILASANLFDNGQTDEGKVYMFLGSASGYPTTPSWTYESNNATATLGNSIDFAGDVNNDGYEDVILGAMNYDMALDEGKVFVFYGNASGLPATPSWQKFGYASFRYMGTLVSSAGDVNNDGYDDVAIVEKISGGTHRVYVFTGSASGLNATYVWNMDLPQKPTDIKAGDINYDGYDDLVIGCPEHNEGTIFCYNGSATGLAATLSWKTSGALYLGELGYAIELEDVTNDGYLDLLASDCILKEEVPLLADYYHDVIIIYPGNGMSVDTVEFYTVESNGSTYTFGHSFDLTDFNGDGYQDLVIGNPESEAPSGFGGSIGIVPSGALGLLGVNHTFFFAEVEDANYGRSVYGGDINGDGYHDMIVSAYGLGLSPVGSSTIIQYGGESLLQDFNTTPQSDSTWQFVDYGDESSCVGDVNGDGYDDVGVAYQNYTNGQIYEGAFLIYHGGPTGISATPTTVVEGNIPNIYFARQLTYGDFNGDGYDDVVTFNYLIDTVFAYYGGPTGISPSPSWRYHLEGVTSVRGIGDFNNDGFGDLAIGDGAYNSNDGRILLFKGSASGLPIIPSSSYQGLSHTYHVGEYLTTTGDINGDGYDDLGSAAWHFENDDFLEGAFFIFYGSAAGTINDPVIVESNDSEMKLGFTFGGAGDVNNDGYHDLLVGQYEPSATRLYYGSPLGLDTSYYTLFDFTFTSEFVNGIGDVNGDAFDDFVLAGESFRPYGTKNEAGAVFVFYGGLSLSDADYCNLITGLEVAGISPTGAAINWDNSPDVSEYTIRWKKMVDTTWVYDTTYTSSYLLTGIESCATYQIQLRTNCEPYASGWSLVTEFASYCTETCDIVTGLSIDSVNLGNMYVSWDADDIAESYIVEYKKSALGVWQSLNVTTSQATLTMLTYCTDYDVRVRTVCSEDSSEYTTILTAESYCTPCYDPPHDLYATNITTTSAKLHWDADPEPINYKVYYRVLGGTTWTKKNATTNLKKISGLLPGTTYEYKVKTECAGGVSTTFSEIALFETLPLRAGASDISSIHVFPNPTHGDFVIILNGLDLEYGELYITDVSGRLLKRYAVVPGVHEYLVSSDLPTGVYLVRYVSPMVQLNRLILIQ